MYVVSCEHVLPSFQGATVFYDAGKLSDIKTPGVAPLDHNHTHFLLVDDGTTHKFGTEIDLRSSLERHICSMIMLGSASNIKSE